MSDEQTVKVGDRLEVPMRVVEAGRKGLVSTIIEGSPHAEIYHFYPDELAGAKRLPPVLKVGQRVRIRDDNSGDEGEIVFIKNHEACIDFADSGLDVEMLSDLEPAS